MRKNRIGIVIGLIAAALLWAGTAVALDPDEKCQALKNKEAGKLASCLQKAEMKLVKTDGTCSVTKVVRCYRDDDCPESETCERDFTKYNEAVLKCTDKFAEKWQKAEDKAAGACPTTEDEAAVQTIVETCVDDVAAALDPSSCGGAGGVKVGGVCWYLGALSASCDATCLAAGLSYDTATLTFAGSGGTWAQCQAVMDALGQTAPPLVDGEDAPSCPSGLGCVKDEGIRFRCTDPVATTATASAPVAYRACACQ